jgi:hypothetical protein
MERVERVTVHVRWRVVRGGGVKGVADGEAGEEEEEEVYLEGRRMVMGPSWGWGWG